MRENRLGVHHLRDELVGEKDQQQERSDAEHIGMQERVCDIAPSYSIPAIEQHAGSLPDTISYFPVYLPFPYLMRTDSMASETTCSHIWAVSWPIRHSHHIWSRTALGSSFNPRALGVSLLLSSDFTKSRPHRYSELSYNSSGNQRATHLTITDWILEVRGDNVGTPGSCF